MDPIYDGPLNFKESRVGLILASPNGVVIEYAFRFDFITSNNRAKFEALIAVLKITKKLGLQELKIYQLGSILTKDGLVSTLQDTRDTTYFKIEECRVNALSHLVT